MVGRLDGGSTGFAGLPPHLALTYATLHALDRRSTGGVARERARTVLGLSGRQLREHLAVLESKRLVIRRPRSIRISRGRSWTRVARTDAKAILESVCNDKTLPECLLCEEPAAVIAAVDRSPVRRTAEPPKASTHTACPALVCVVAGGGSAGEFSHRRLSAERYTKHTITDEQTAALFGDLGGRRFSPQVAASESISALLGVGNSTKSKIPPPLPAPSPAPPLDPPSSPTPSLSETGPGAFGSRSSVSFPPHHLNPLDDPSGASNDDHEENTEDRGARGTPDAAAAVLGRTADGLRLLLLGREVDPFALRLDAERGRLRADEVAALVSTHGALSRRTRWFRPFWDAMVAGMAARLRSMYVTRWAMATGRPERAWDDPGKAGQDFRDAAVVAARSGVTVERLLACAEDMIRCVRYPAPMHLRGPALQQLVRDWLPPAERRDGAVTEALALMERTRSIERQLSITQPPPRVTHAFDRVWPGLWDDCVPRKGDQTDDGDE